MQSVRRSRSVLVELMIAVLFLAVASCVLAQLFASAWEMSGDSRRTQTAVLLARDALERFCAGEELPETWLQTVDGQEYEVSARITGVPSPAGSVDTCTVTVTCGENAPLQLRTARYTTEVWQNEDP